MRTVEVIRVRSSSDLREYVNSKYLDRIKGSPLAPGLEMVKLFFPASHNTECMLALSWLDDSPQVERSRLADVLLRELKRLGVTDHSIWFERYRIHERPLGEGDRDRPSASETAGEQQYQQDKESAM